MVGFSTSVMVTDVAINRNLDGTTWTESSSSTPVEIGVNYVDRYKNPSFRIQIARGQNASMPYTNNGYVIKPGFYRIRTRSGATLDSNHYRTIGAQPGLYPALTWNGIDHIAEAGMRLRRKVRESTGSSNQLVNLVELRELPRTIVGAAESAIGLISSVTTSKRKGRDLKKYASDSWLTWSFGIAPTLGAIDELIASIDAYKNRTDLSQRDYGVSGGESLRSTSIFTSASAGYSVLLKGQFKQDYSCKLTSGYRVNMKSDNSYTMAKHLGFSIDKVVPTAWELLPFSWMFDYFSNAGQYLEDTFEISPAKQIYLCQSVKNRIKGEVTAQPVKVAASALLLDFDTKPAQIEIYQFARTPLATIPRAVLRLKTPNEVGFSAVTKLLNLASLLGSKS